MRVLHVHSGNLFGGVERILETLAEASDACAGMETSAALCSDGRLGDQLTAAGATVHRLGSVRASRPWQVALARRALTRTLTANRPDVAVVHSDWSHALFGNTIRSAGVPLVRWMHAADPGPAWQAWGAERAVPALVICNSRYTCRGSQGRFAGTPRAVCYAPVVFRRADRDEARAAADLAPSTVVILLAARFEACKGHLVLLKALALLRDVGGWEAWIVGGPQRDEERRRLGDLVRGAAAAGLSERVRFLGERGDVQSLMAAADIYCQPNEGPESYGMSFVEAMGAGLPVVSTDLGALPEVVDETCGVLVRPGDAQAISGALRQLIEDPVGRRELSRGAQARAAALGDPDARFRDLTDAFRSVLDEPLPRGSVA